MGLPLAGHYSINPYFIQSVSPIPCFKSAWTFLLFNLELTIKLKSVLDCANMKMYQVRCWWRSYARLKQQLVNILCTDFFIKLMRTTTFEFWLHALQYLGLIVLIFDLYSWLFSWACCPNFSHYLESLLWIYNISTCERLCFVCAFVTSVYSDVTEITQETNSPFSLIEEVITLTKRKHIKANKPKILSR